MSVKNINSNFIISIDFELIWGMHEGDMLSAKAITSDKGYNLKTVVLLKDQRLKEYID